jgi:hypothetical protein
MKLIKTIALATVALQLAEMAAAPAAHATMFAPLVLPLFSRLPKPSPKAFRATTASFPHL